MTDLWLMLWKGVFVIGLIIFVIMAVWVTLGGWADIRSLLQGLEEKPHDQEPKDSGS